MFCTEIQYVVPPIVRPPSARHLLEVLTGTPHQQRYVIPIQKNLQGHREGSQLWTKHIARIMTEGMGFKQTTHEPCLYFKRDPTTGSFVIMLRQIDDFLIAGATIEECDNIRAGIQTHMKNKLNDLDTVRLYNGIDI